MEIFLCGSPIGLFSTQAFIVVKQPTNPWLIYFIKAWTKERERERDVNDHQLTQLW